MLKAVQRGFYLSLLAMLLAICAGYALSQSIKLDKNTEAGIAVQSVNIVWLLVSIPGILWLYRRQVERKRPADSSRRLRNYRTWIILRYAVIAISLTGNAILFFLYVDKSFFLCGAIAVVALLFCRPDRVRIENELGMARDDEIL